MNLIKFFLQSTWLFVKRWAILLGIGVMVLVFFAIRYWEVVSQWLPNSYNPMAIIIGVLFLAFVLHISIKEYRIRRECLQCGTFDTQLVKTAHRGEYTTDFHYQCRNCENYWVIPKSAYTDS